MRNSDLSRLLLLTTAATLVGTAAMAANLTRLTANYFKFDSTQFQTNVTADKSGTPDGFLFFRKRVAVPPHSNVLFITVYGSASVHKGAAEWLSCRLNGNFCRPSVMFGTQTPPPPGWVSLQKLPANTENLNCATGGDCHYNGISYSWCVQVPNTSQESSFTVDLKMASSDAGKDVFLLHGHVYIDSALVRSNDACTDAGNPS